MAEVTQAGGDPKGGKVRSKKSSTKIDMTPLVDLAFLLLTFFMLTTTFNKPQTMEIIMPEKPKSQDDRPAVNEKKVITLVLDEDDKIFWYHGITDPTVEQTSFSGDGIRKVLLDHRTSIPEMFVLIKPTDRSRYRNVVDILDEMVITNIGRYALVEATAEDLELIKVKTGSK